MLNAAGLIIHLKENLETLLLDSYPVKAYIIVNMYAVQHFEPLPVFRITIN